MIIYILAVIGLIKGLDNIPASFLVLIAVNSNYYYDGSHASVTDDDMVYIPNNPARIASSEYRLGITLNSDPKIYIYYVRFKGAISTTEC